VVENIRLLPAIRPHLSPAALVTDTGSTKAAVVEAAAGLRFIGGHPIAGGSTSGHGAASADLFAGRRWILTPTAGTAGADLARLTAFVETVGARVVLLDAAEHDRILALVSHLPQLAVSALMHVVGSQAGAGGLALAGPGLRDSTRLAASAPDIWQDVQATNEANITAALDLLIGELARLRDDPRGEALAAIFQSASAWKQTLDDTPI
jgi:prephenate dehydrogenase